MVFCNRKNMKILLINKQNMMFYLFVFERDRQTHII